MASRHEPSPDGIAGRYFSTMFKDAPTFQHHLLQHISETRQHGDGIHTDLVYTDIAPSWAESAYSALEARRLVCFKSYNPVTQFLKLRAMATPLHNADQEWFARSREIWLNTGVLNVAERNMLLTSANTRMEKAPNVGVQLNGTGLPRVVFESGFSQSGESLRDDMLDWFLGGGGSVQAVILVNWRPSLATMHIRGDVELYALGRDGIPRLQERQQIYPRPSGPAGRQTLRLTRKMFFGNTIGPGRSPNDPFLMELDQLRSVADMIFPNMGYQAA
ncbi:hypothetical protein BDV32DRAFT_149125 [Aspergillus pseudonomiae]|uniref:Uncharacterized protein n=1 Tax=Aspergillus pseudonomiae TaxID=1506151 RepID=A0A5N6I1U5_9EURO|nr:uncharacterized protein BDV37DRAFT_280934 [Aspergillus pseudonomiae]KAB8260691.1 hypothetical protein BDV32DRAFT_149125 [Aspergillus pseudonomiae]KAE8406337.1 hypothetical protein BDV37DRAFT_280934 [Aspergillus pseudonomiae]